MKIPTNVSWWLIHLAVVAIATVVFVTLKLRAVVAWPWWFVLFPLWFPLALALAIIGGTICIYWLVDRQSRG